MSTTITPTRTFTAAALEAELGRRKNNRKRRANNEDPKRAKSFVLPRLSKADMRAIKEGAVVTVTFQSGRTEHVGLR